MSLFESLKSFLFKDLQGRNGLVTAGGKNDGRRGRLSERFCGPSHEISHVWHVEGEEAGSSETGGCKIRLDRHKMIIVLDGRR